MKFRSELEIREAAHTISYPQAILLAGSCFTEHMGEEMRRYRFPVLQNPHGILFNPISLTNMLLSLVEGRRYGPEDLFQYGGRWSSWDHHGQFSTTAPGPCLEAVNQAQEAGIAFLRKADWLFLTLGSAWVYELKTTKHVVANCHKAPADWFNHRLLSVEEVLSSLDQLIHRLFLLRPSLRILFTISPVRHLREGMVENNRSKAVLIQAVHHLAGKFDRIDYFPAYELVIDDLRDYRFYAEDLVHPNYQATRYVWEKFCAAFMDEEARSVMQALEPILAARRHKPFDPDSEEHLRFLRRMAEQSTALESRYPFLDLSDEIAYFRR